MAIVTDTGIVHNTDGSILFAPEPVVTPVGMYYFGVIDSVERPEKAEFTELTQAVANTDASTIEVAYPDTAGWLIYAESIQSPVRTKWYISFLNQGIIGGNWDDFDPNLFPDPITQSYFNKLWRVYITSYITKVSNPISFLS